MPGRVGDTITDPTMARCEGCGQSELLCQVCIDHDSAKCCGVCTHLHDAATLARYGLLDR